MGKDVWNFRGAIMIDQDRLRFERELVRLYAPSFCFHVINGSPYLEGNRYSNGGKSYRAKIILPSDYPYNEPALYITSPHTLWMRGGNQTINSLGTSHNFHTYDNGSGGCVKICHSDYWDASMNCLTVIKKFAIWTEAHQGHLRTGNSIAWHLGDG
jgi:hypothetical protein